MKIAKKEAELCCGWRTKGARGLFFLGAALFGALGFAAMVQGILLQLRLGFAYGFYAYLLGLLFLGAAKFCKWRAYAGCCPEWHMAKH